MDETQGAMSLRKQSQRVRFAGGITKGAMTLRKQSQRKIFRATQLKETISKGREACSIRRLAE